MVHLSAVYRFVIYMYGIYLTDALLLCAADMVVMFYLRDH